MIVTSKWLLVSWRRTWLWSNFLSTSSTWWTNVKATVNFGDPNNYWWCDVSGSLSGCISTTPGQQYLQHVQNLVASQFFLGAIRLTKLLLSTDLLGLWLVGNGLAGNGTLLGCAWGSGLIIRKTPGVPLPKPIMSNIIMCRKNSPTLEHEAQNGPQVFLPLLQQAGYPPPKHSPIPWACSM